MNEITPPPGFRGRFARERETPGPFRWRCAACGAENVGAFEAGCTVCGVGSPGYTEPAPAVANEPPPTDNEVMDAVYDRERDLTDAACRTVGRALAFYLAQGVRGDGELSPRIARAWAAALLEVDEDTPAT